MFGEEEYDKVEEQIAILQQEVAQASKDHAILFAREEKILIKEARQRYFEQADTRQVSLFALLAILSLRSFTGNQTGQPVLRPYFCGSSSKL